jgi:Fe-S cluster assembly protein SufD
LADRSSHLWRYTSSSAFDAPAAPSAPTPRVELSEAARAAGVRVRPLADSPEALAVLGQAVPAGHGPLEDRNRSAWNAGLAVLVPAGAVVAEPVRVVFPAAAGTLPRLVVQVGEGADVMLVEQHEGGGEGVVVVGVSELFAAAGSRVVHAVRHAWQPGTRAHLTSRLVLDRDAVGLSALAAVGGDLVKVDVGAVLAGPGASSEIVSLVAADGSRHVDVHTRHEHRAGRTHSNVVAKASLAGRARSVYTGLIRIEQGARGAEAYQENRNLMLSDTARADTIPELEILNDEVACTHGATVAPVDPAALFYLESRGLAPSDAVQVLVEGFYADALARLPEAVRPWLAVSPSGRLSDLQREAA